MKPMHFTTENDLLSILSDADTQLLKHCYGSVRLSSGIGYSLHAMERVVEKTDSQLTITAGGDKMVPKLEWKVLVLPTGLMEITLAVTNTMSAALPIERMDVLANQEGYAAIDPKDLYVRRTGWQMSSPAAVRRPFLQEDPWMQPPVFMPRGLSSSPYQQHLAWMTVLQSDQEQPLLIGFGSAKDYLGMISIAPSPDGHSITASNHIEDMLLQPGETITSEPLLVAWGSPEQQLLDAYADYVATAMDARVPDHIPTGWSHWLYYFAKVTEEDILENTRLIHEKNIPVEYIQIDDGYQTYFGDWLSINDRFPSGMKHAADKIRETDRKPGIWLALMADSRSEVATNHPDWFLHDEHGELINVVRQGDTYWKVPFYGLDITHPDAYAWFEQVLRTICEEWGYEYLKVDFVYAAAMRAKRYDPTYTSVQAYRKAMQLIRDVAGDRIVLGCGAPLLCSVGLVDDMRIGPDLSHEFLMPGQEKLINPVAPTTHDPLQSIMSHMWMNKKFWINDFDYVRLRQHDIDLGWPETIALTTLIAMGGGAIYNSDKLATLEPEGYALFDRLLPAADVTSHVVGKVIGKPNQLRATRTVGETTWHIVAAFNWGDTDLDNSFTPERWEIEQGEYHVFDLLSRRYIGRGETVKLDPVSPREVGLFCITRATDLPSVIATGGHLLGPIGDIASVQYSDNALTINATKSPRAKTVMYISLPDNRIVTHIEGGEIIEQSDNLVAVAIDAGKAQASLTVE